MILYIIGAGGHGKVAADIAFSLNKYKEIIFLDDKKEIDSKVLNFKVLNKINFEEIKLLNNEETNFFVAIGDCQKRKLIQDQLIKNQINLTTLIHPFTSISIFSNIGIGSLVCPGSIVGPDTIIGKGVILNHSSTIDHDCIVEDYVHLCPHSSIAGNVTIGKLCTLGTGSRVIPEKKIGEQCFIGAGSVVLKDIPDGKTAVGIPAKF